MVIFYCLCRKYKMMITKAKFMIVIPTNPKKSSLMINNNASTIVPPPLSVSHTKAVEIICTHQKEKGGNTLCLFSFS